MARKSMQRATIMVQTQTVTDSSRCKLRQPLRRPKLFATAGRKSESELQAAGPPGPQGKSQLGHKGARASGTPCQRTSFAKLSGRDTRCKQNLARQGSNQDTPSSGPKAPVVGEAPSYCLTCMSLLRLSGMMTAHKALLTSPSPLLEKRICARVWGSRRSELSRGGATSSTLL